MNECLKALLHVFGNLLKVIMKFGLCGMLGILYVGDVWWWGCEMLGIWDVGNVGYWDMGFGGCGMLGCKILGMRDVGDMGCSGCGMFKMRDVRAVGRGMFAGMWNVDLENVPLWNLCLSIPLALPFLIVSYYITNIFAIRVIEHSQYAANLTMRQRRKLYVS